MTDASLLTTKNDRSSFVNPHETRSQYCSNTCLKLKAPNSKNPPTQPLISDMAYHITAVPTCCQMSCLPLNKSEATYV